MKPKAHKNTNGPRRQKKKAQAKHKNRKKSPKKRRARKHKKKIDQLWARRAWVNPPGKPEADNPQNKPNTSTAQSSTVNETPKRRRIRRYNLAGNADPHGQYNRDGGYIG